MPELHYDVLVHDGLPRHREQRLPDGSPIVSSPVTTTLIYGDHDAVIVDPPFTYAQVHRVAEWVKSFGRRLVAVYATLLAFAIAARLLPLTEYGLYMAALAAMELGLAFSTAGLDWVATRCLPEYRLHASGRATVLDGAQALRRAGTGLPARRHPHHLLDPQPISTGYPR